MTGKITHIFILLIAVFVALTSCIEDGFTASPSDRPEFSTDTLDMGVAFTGEVTPTFSFKVFNPHKKGLNFSNVAITGANAEYFRLNVDGFSGTQFSDVEIRANDSIFVFVEATPPVSGQALPKSMEAEVVFTLNGVKYPVVVKVHGQDIVRLNGLVVNQDMRLDSPLPYQVTDSLVVAPGATLTLAPGTTMLMHDGAYLAVDGRIISEGTSDAPVRITGDRLGNVIPDVSFDIMSRQWDGVYISSLSKGNSLSHTEISNTSNGVIVVGDGIFDTPSLTLTNCRLRNSGSVVLAAVDASILAAGCEFAEGAEGLIALQGGRHRFDFCTVSNHYLFAAVSQPAWQFWGLTADSPDLPPSGLPIQAEITNTITYGIGGDAYPTDLTGSQVYFRRCLFKSAGEDDDNFIQCIWDADPLFYTVREEYVFDYRLRPDSPAIDAADPSLSLFIPEVDYYGIPRRADLGAYTYVAP